MNRHSLNLLHSNLGRSVVPYFEKLVRFMWRDAWNLDQVERALDDLNYKSPCPNDPYSERLLNKYWWWYASGFIVATRHKVGDIDCYSFKVKFFNEDEVELKGVEFKNYMDARKNIDLEYVDVIYNRGRFNSKGALKKFLNDELELDRGE